MILIIIILLLCENNSDWGPKIDVVGFCFLDLASNYEPPEELTKWLEAGEKPIYIGFGSLVSTPSFLLDDMYCFCSPPKMFHFLVSFVLINFVFYCQVV